MVQDMQQLDAVGEMFTACKSIVSALGADKALRAAFKSLAERHGTSGLIRPAPSHRFAYQVGGLRKGEGGVSRVGIMKALGSLRVCRWHWLYHMWHMWAVALACSHATSCTFYLTAGI